MVSKKGNRKPMRKKPRSKPVQKKLARQDSDNAEPSSSQIEATNDDWPESLQPSPEFKKIKARLWKRWRRLARNKEFVWETARLKWKLNRLYEDNPDLIRKFVRTLFSLSLGNVRELTKLIAGSPEEFRPVLGRYMNYCLQYSVAFRLFPKPPYFRVEGNEGATGDRFQVVIRKGDLAPRGALDAAFDPVFPDGFESNVQASPPELEGLVRAGIVKYVQIDDKDKFSLFRQMFLFAHATDQVTAFRYNSVPKYTLFLVGQNVSLTDIWPKLRKVIAADQRSSTQRDQRGAPTKVRKLYGELNTLMRGKGSQSNRAARFVTDKISDGYQKRLASKESYLSQLKRRLEE